MVRRVSTIRITNRFNQFRNKCSLDLEIRNKQTELLAQILPYRIQESLSTLQEHSTFRKSEENISIFLKYNTIIKAFASLRNNTLHLKLQQKLNHQISRFRFIQTLRRYFTAFRNQLIKDKCEQ